MDLAGLVWPQILLLPSFSPVHLILTPWDFFLWNRKGLCTPTILESATYHYLEFRERISIATMAINRMSLQNVKCTTNRTSVVWPRRYTWNIHSVCRKLIFIYHSFLYVLILLTVYQFENEGWMSFVFLMYVPLQKKFEWMLKFWCNRLSYHSDKFYLDSQFVWLFMYVLFLLEFKFT